MHARLQPKAGVTAFAAYKPRSGAAARVVQRAALNPASGPATDLQGGESQGLGGHALSVRETIADYARSHASGLARAAAGPNRTGLPDRLKSGIETLSGIALDDVRVHRNSSRPAQLQALAHAQGSDIHLGPGQERHLAHEAWHVVQQKQGRVRPTMQLGGTAINDDAGLEREAETMGAQAAGMQMGGMDHATPRAAPAPRAMPGGLAPVQRFRVVEAQGKKWDVSNDDTAATVDVVNNKDFYATEERITQANDSLKKRDANVALASTGGKLTVNKTTLLKIIPQIEKTNVTGNLMGPELSPAVSGEHDAVTGVDLPSACEKGAMAVIGAVLHDQREVPHTMDYSWAKHDQGRMANLIALTSVDELAQHSANTRWKDFDKMRHEAIALYSEMKKNGRLTDLAKVDEVRSEVRKVNGDLADKEFDTNFELKVDHYETRTTRPASITVLSDMIQTMNVLKSRIEHRVMSNIDPVYQGYHDDVLAAKGVQEKLIELYTAKEFPRSVIDEALRLVGKQDERGTYFTPKKGDGDTYGNNLTFFADSRMTDYIQSIARQLNNTVFRLEEQRDARFGAVGNRNTKVDPKVGEAYGIIGGGYDMRRGGDWNWHWASVVMKTLTDNVTMEAHASHRRGDETHNERWDFKMYGRPGLESSQGKTFHDIWRGQGFGLRPVTILGQPKRTHPPSVARNNLDEVESLGGKALLRHKSGVLELFTIEGTLAKSRGKDDILDCYDRTIDRVLELTTGEIPRNFVEQRLHDPLNRQAEAIIALRRSTRGGVDELSLEIDVEKTANEVRDGLRQIFDVLDSYERAGRKSGAFD